MKKAWNIIYGMITEIFFFLVCIIIYPFSFSKLRLPREDERDKPPALCVHGYFHTATSWIWFRRQLKRLGMGTINTVTYHSLTKNIPDNSFILKSRIDQYKQETGQDITLLIGHSEGGLVCLEYALEHAPKDRLIHVITLGSPLHGTPVAKLGFGPGCRQMERGSTYLKSLQDRLQAAKHIRLYALATQADMLIHPYTSALMKEWKYAENEVMDDLGHVALMFSPRVVNYVVSYLKRQGIL